MIGLRGGPKAVASVLECAARAWRSCIVVSVYDSINQIVGLNRASEDPTISPLFLSLRVRSKHLGFPVAHRRTRHFAIRQLVRIFRQDLHCRESTSAVVPSDNQVASDVFVQSWFELDDLKPNAAGEIGQYAYSLCADDSDFARGGWVRGFMPVDMGWDLGMDVKS
jgi:hypothetical protein